MKNYTWILLITLGLGATACGSDANENTDDKDGNGEQTEVSTSEFGDIKALMAQKEYTHVELNRLTTFLDGKELMITGYPYAYPLGEGKDVEFTPGSTDMIDGIDNSVDNVAVRVKFKNEEEPRTMKIGELFGVKGIVEVSYSVNEEYGNTTRIYIKDAEFIADPTAKKGSTASIEDIDTTKQIFLGDLYSIMEAHYEALCKKGKMTVTGKYLSTTTSKNYAGTEILEIRVDLGDYDNKVGCEFDDAPDGDKLTAARNAGKEISISGKFAGTVFGNPRLSGCAVE